MLRAFICLVGMLFTDAVLSQDLRQFKDRFATIAAEAEVVADRYSFCCRATTMMDETSLDRDEGIATAFVRVARAEGGKRRRVDGYSRQFTTTEVKEVGHDLLFNEKHLKAVGFESPSKLKEVDRSLGFRPRFSDANPFWSVFGLQIDFVEGDRGRTAKDYENIRVVTEGHRKDGNYEALLVTNLGITAIRVVFSEKPHWAPMEVTFYKNPGKAIRPEFAVAEDLSKWRELGRNQAEWVAIGDQWVPRKLILRYVSGRTSVKYETEVEYVNWRFGDKVDDELFRQENFTLDRLRGLGLEELEKELFSKSKKDG